MVGAGAVLREGHGFGGHEDLSGCGSAVPASVPVVGAASHYMPQASISSTHSSAKPPDRGTADGLSDGRRCQWRAIASGVFERVCERGKRVGVERALRVVLVDVNDEVVKAWRSAFADTPEVEIRQGSLLDVDVDAWVSPTNARGRMDGGVDAVVKRHLGAGVQVRVQREIRARFGASLPVGSAVCVPSGAAVPRYLISTPTMRQSSQNVSETMNVALACAAAFQAVHLQNREKPGSIRSVALVGMGAQTGRVPHGGVRQSGCGRATPCSTTTGSRTTTSCGPRCWGSSTTSREPGPRSGYGSSFPGFPGWLPPAPPRRGPRLRRGPPPGIRWGWPSCSAVVVSRGSRCWVR